MSNPTTAAEWKAVAQGLVDQTKANDANIKQLRDRRALLEDKITNLLNQLDRAPVADRAFIQYQVRSLSDEQVKIDDSISQIATQNLQLTVEWRNANAQAELAEKGEPNTNTNTPPANPSPGNNTEVPPSTPPIQTTSAAANVTPAEDPAQSTPTAAAVENTTPAPIQQYSNRPPQPAEEIPYTQRTVDADPTSTIQAQVAVEQQQKQIAINTAGLPVVAEDNSVATGILKNPETGQNYFTTPPNEISQNPSATGSARGLQGAKRRTRAQATSQDAAYLSRLPDWRVKLQLAPGATYLYKSETDAGILQPLQETEGVIFPYTPQIQIQYGAHYEPTDLTHSNYKIFQYKNSSVDNISITADFTAQDTYEARYVLAVIHFFRSVTKMFYGRDENPRNGTPPPLCYITGLGEFNFNQHPLAITNFTYTLPNDVDYIRANTEANSPPGVNQSAANVPNNTGNPVTDRTTSSGIQPGGKSLGPKFNINPPGSSNYKTGAKDPTYVPTKMQIQLTAVPIVSRNVISNVFSLREYGSGKLLQGSKHAGVKGVW